MDKFTFVCKFINEGAKLIPDYNNGYFNVLFELKRLTKYVDYSCNIKIEDGETYCARYPSRGKTDRYSSMLCCESCCRSFGFPTDLVLPSRKKILTEIWRLYDPERNGFWKQFEGCALKREWRSATCLSHMCNNFRFIRREALPLEDQQLLGFIVDLSRYDGIQNNTLIRRADNYLKYYTQLKAGGEEDEHS